MFSTPRRFYGYNPLLAGDPENSPYRWQAVVRFLDAHLRGWAPTIGRATNPKLGQAARVALEKLIGERDDARDELARMRAWRLSRSYGGANPFANIRSAAPPPSPDAAQSPHADAPTLHLDGTTTYPQWGESYTKRVVEALRDAIVGTPSITPRTRVYQTALDAIKLLKDYHRTQHEVYEGRDAARTAAKEANDKLVEMKGKLAHAIADAQQQREASERHAETTTLTVQMYLGQRDRARADAAVSRKALDSVRDAITDAAKALDIDVT